MGNFVLSVIILLLIGFLVHYIWKNSEKNKKIDELNELINNEKDKLHKETNELKRKIDVLIEEKSNKDNNNYLEKNIIRDIYFTLNKYSIDYETMNKLKEILNKIENMPFSDICLKGILEKYIQYILKDLRDDIWILQRENKKNDIIHEVINFGNNKNDNIIDLINIIESFQNYIMQYFCFQYILLKIYKNNELNVDEKLIKEKINAIEEDWKNYDNEKKNRFEGDIIF